MKPLIIKATLLVVAAMGLSQYMHYLITGKNPLDNFSLPSFSFNAPSLPAGKQTVYKWVDENGVTRYSEDAPAEQAAVQTLEIDPDVNVVQALKISPKQEEKDISPSPALDLPQGNIYSPDTIKQVMDDAKNVQNLMNERLEQQEKALNSL